MTYKELNQADATKALNEAHTQLRTTACTHADCIKILIFDSWSISHAALPVRHRFSIQYK